MPQIEVRKTNAQIQRDYERGMNPTLYRRTLLETLDGITMEEYTKNYKGRIKNAHDHDRYDTAIIPAATAVSAGDKQLFNVPNAQTGPNLAGTNYKRDEADTNMVEANQLEFGNFLIVESFQVQILATTREYAAFTDAKPTDLAPAAAGTIAASNSVAGIANDFFIDFKVGKRSLCSGPLIKFPSEYVLSGAFGADTDEGFVQVGMGKPRPLREVVVLQPKQNFTVTIKVFRATTVPQNLKIRVYLCGVLLESVT